MSNDVVKGDPNCPHCHGTGVMYQPNGQDDVNAEVCVCVIAQEKGSPFGGSFKK